MRTQCRRADDVVTLMSKHFASLFSLLYPGRVSPAAFDKICDLSYLEPDMIHGMAYLEAVKAVFGPNKKTDNGQL